MECKDAKKNLSNLNVQHNKEMYQKHVVAYKALLQKKRRK